MGKDKLLTEERQQPMGEPQPLLKEWLLIEEKCVLAETLEMPMPVSSHPPTPASQDSSTCPLPQASGSPHAHRKWRKATQMKYTYPALVTAKELTMLRKPVQVQVRPVIFHPFKYLPV